jgi:disulfide bond formation protein DsbB
MMGWKHFMKENGMHLSWLVALVATLGSLFFSEVLDYLPCKLCWYQRILMYPLVLILGIAAVRKDYKMTIYVLPMALWGACISTYHILMQETSWFKEAATSCGPVPCDRDYIHWLGFITIPMLAAAAFVVIAFLQFLTWRASRQE